MSGPDVHQQPAQRETQDETVDNELQLTAVESRVLGCLIEKQATTPDAYPMTLNALLTACNQKTNRDPVMALEPGKVGHALRTLEERGMVRGQMSARSTRYEHNFDRIYDTTSRPRAVLAMLMLRGPQTINELHTRCARLADFPAPEDMADTLDRLEQRSPPLAMRLPRASGQREDRFMHLLCGPLDIDALLESAARSPARPSSSAASELLQRLEELEARVTTLEQHLDGPDTA